jgi:hypothetical protein
MALLQFLHRVNSSAHGPARIDAHHGHSKSSAEVNSTDEAEEEEVEAAAAEVVGAAEGDEEEEEEGVAG